MAERATGTVPRPSASLRREFDTYVARWRDNTADLSRVQAIVADSNYLAIATMGRPALPLILAELRDRGGYWFPLLEALTGESPESDDERQSRVGMREAWLRWGRAHGYLPN